MLALQIVAVTGYLYMRRGWGSPIFRAVESFIRANPEMLGRRQHTESN